MNLPVGATDIGQGSDTVLAQICAEELGIPYDKVLILSSDTDLTPFDVGAYASSTTYISGGAVVKAAAMLREQLAEVLAAHWECAADDIVFAEGMVTGPAGQTMTMPEVALYRLVRGQDPAHGHGQPHVQRFAAALCRPVRRRGGGYGNRPGFPADVWFRRWIAARPSIPHLAEGQIEGAVAQAMGYALFEEVLLDRTGRVLNPNFLDYKIASALDMPEMVTILVADRRTDRPVRCQGGR